MDYVRPKQWKVLGATAVVGSIYPDAKILNHHNNIFFVLIPLSCFPASEQAGVAGVARFPACAFLGSARVLSNASWVLPRRLSIFLAQ